jgi:hypothetical protein
MKPRELDLSMFDAGYDVATQVLTTRGWQKFTDLQNDDRVFVWSDGVLELERVLECYTRKYEGLMYPIINRHIDIFCMPGTKILAKVRPHTRTEISENWSDTRAEYIKPTWQLQIPVAGLWAGEKTVIPKTAHDTGLWCSGILREDTDIRLDRESVSLLRQMVEGLAFVERTPEEYKRMMRLMMQTNPNQELTWDMLMWSRAAREQLLFGLMVGRGRRYPPALVWLFLSTREGRLDVFQAIAMSLGWRAQISASNGVFFSTSKSTSSVYYKHRRPPENWKGVVWNIRTDAGHMVVRRENKIAIVSTL